MEFCWNLRFQISQLFDKISDPYNKTTGKIEKKDVKNTKKLKKK